LKECGRRKTKFEFKGKSVRKWGAIFFGIIFSLLLFCEIAYAEQGALDWQNRSNDLFQTARKENKLVILNLEAVWCHWCHVMADTTYHDPKVVELIHSKYIPVRVDQDANPDLSLRYENWGWPATVIFAADGTEIVKRRGYIPPEVMASLLDAVIKDPTPGPSVLRDMDMKPSSEAFLSPETKKILLENHLSFYDKESGGWGTQLKLIDANHLEFALVKSQSGDTSEETMARRTLDAALNLLDPEWCGFYQYSESRDWKSPHFEKIMPIQAQSMRLYALGYALWHDPRYLGAAENTEKYVADFWTDKEGGFYTSQDADADSKLTGHSFYALKNPERKALGKMPRIDTHIYSRENGWMISSLTVLHSVTGDKKYIEKAARAAEWILKNRNLPDGGFRHDTRDERGPYLGDTLSMGQALLDLYVSTGEWEWLPRSENAAGFIRNFFMDKKAAGFFSAVSVKDGNGVFNKPIKQIDENVAVVRWTNLLFHYTGKIEYKKMAEHAMKYLASPDLIQSNHFLAGILLADMELGSDPVHVTIVGHKDDPHARTLFETALRYPVNYRRVEWWDKREGPLPNPDVEYPELEKAAAFGCADHSCSAPFFTPEKLTLGLDRLRNKQR